MAKNNKKNQTVEATQAEIFNMNPNTKGAIFTTIVFLVAFLSVLSLFNLAGPFGQGLNYALGFLFGWSDWLFILLLLLIGYWLLISPEHKIKIVTYLGLFVLIISVSGLFNFFVSNFNFNEIVSTGRGGGASGWAMGWLFTGFLGFWGSLLFFIAIFLVGLFLAFNTSFKDLREKTKSLSALKDKVMPLASDFVPETEDEEEEFDNTEIEDEPVKESEIVDGKDEEENTETNDDEEVPVTVKKSNIKKIVVPIDLLKVSTGKPDSGDINANMQKIKKTFENFGIEVEMAEVNVGPTVTQYTLRPAEGVRLSQVLTLQNDLALALAAHPIRMEAPIPGKSLVGIEVPNQSVSIVKLRDIIESSVYNKRKGNLYIALGKDVSGAPIMANLANMPHLLIAGSTGSGKSVCVNNIILSLIYENSPADLQFILIDPKRVELSAYNDIPYLLSPVINDTDKIINALRWVVKEMNERYKLLQAANKRNLDSYNKAVIVNRLPYLVVIVDEFAALMSVAAKEVEAAVSSLAQLGRAAGIHLILATQRPSVDVITGLIKANVTSRIAFGVASAMDSRTIIDSSGADKLLGKGDMLFMTAEASKVKRIQGAYVTDEEINEITDFLREQAEPSYNNDVTEKMAGTSMTGFGAREARADELFEEAKEIVIKGGKASATLLQRRLRIGYARAAGLLDALEQQGVVGPASGAKAREVLISQDDLENNFSTSLDEVDDDDEDKLDDEDVEAEQVLAERENN